MSLSQEPEVLDVGPVDNPGSLISTLARGPSKSGYRHTVPRSRVDRSDEGKGDDESEDETNPSSPRQRPALPPGGSNGDPPQDGDDDKDDKEDDNDSSDSEMGEAEDGLSKDLNNAGTGKFYKPQIPNSKAMAKMFHHFCDLAE
jgi:hypothetical protein